MSPVIRPGQIGVEVIGDPLTAADLVAASNIWPGVFAYSTPLERLLTDQVVRVLRIRPGRMHHQVVRALRALGPRTRP